jgi:hypothetical protein
MITYSQAGQDKFVLSFFDDDYKGFFIDIGCALPININNTMLLEKHEWRGVSLDINNLSNEWKVRNTPFVCADALTMDYTRLFQIYLVPKVVDYLSLDIEGDGGRYLALSKLFEANHEFKIITIEHDAYRGYGETERKKQRDFLLKMGYFLVCSNVTLGGNPFEDWWINPKYISEDKYLKLVSDNLSHYEILKKL